MKAICKLSKKELAKVLPSMCRNISQCRYVCRKCGRFAPKRSALCKATSLAKMTKIDSLDADELEAAIG